MFGKTNETKGETGMRWTFLVITSNYKKYVEYFTQQYKNVKVTKDRAKFEDAHTYIEV